MTTSARLLTILTLSLPLGACAAQPAPAAQAPLVQTAKPGQDAQAGNAAVTPAPAAPAAAPASAPAAQPAAPAAVQPHAADTPQATPRRSAAAQGSGSVASPAAEAPATPAPAANAPVLNPSSPGAPETTVGGGAANRGAPAVAPVPMASGSATGSLLQTLFALIAVLAVLGALAWFLKRYGPKAGTGSANLRVVGALNLGGRERVLVVEVGNQWIVVGASPGRINALATMPKQEGAEMTGSGATLAPHSQPANNFADWLKQTIDKRK